MSDESELTGMTPGTRGNAVHPKRCRWCGKKIHVRNVPAVTADGARKSRERARRGVCSACERKKRR